MDLRRASLAGWPGTFSRNIWLIWANTLFIFISLGVFVLIFNLYLSSLGLREDYIGMFSFANTAAIGAMAIPASFLSNRFGPRICLVVASLLMGISAIAVAFVSSPVLIVALGAVYGAGNAMIFVPSGPFMMDNSREDQRLTVFSGNFAVMSTATVVGSLISGYLPGLFATLLGLGPDSVTETYRWTLVFGSVFCLLGALPMILAREASRARGGGTGSQPTVQPLSPRAARTVILHTCATVVLTSVSAGLIIPFFNIYLSQQLGASVEEIGIVYAAASLLMVPFSLAGPAFSRRFGTVNTIVFARLLTIPFILPLAFAPSMALGSVAYIARAALLGVTWPVDNAYSMALMPPRMRALSAGTRSASWNIGWSISSLVAGQVIILYGYSAVFATSCAFVLAGGVYYLAKLRRYEARFAPEPLTRVESEV